MSIIGRVAKTKKFIFQLLLRCGIDCCRPAGLHSDQWPLHREDLQGAPPALGHSWAGEVGYSFLHFPKSLNVRVLLYFITCNDLFMTPIKSGQRGITFMCKK